jgi:hypothetical protein
VGVARLARHPVFPIGPDRVRIQSEASTSRAVFRFASSSFEHPGGIREFQLQSFVVERQAEWILATFGEDAATSANYGWSTDGQDEPLSAVMPTKVYGHGILTTLIREGESGLEGRARVRAV